MRAQFRLERRDKGQRVGKVLNGLEAPLVQVAAGRPELIRGEGQDGRVTGGKNVRDGRVRGAVGRNNVVDPLLNLWQAFRYGCCNTALPLGRLLGRLAAESHPDVEAAFETTRPAVVPSLPVDAAVGFVQAIQGRQVGLPRHGPAEKSRAAITGPDVVVNPGGFISAHGARLNLVRRVVHRQLLVTTRRLAFR